MKGGGGGYPGWSHEREGRNLNREALPAVWLASLGADLFEKVHFPLGLLGSCDLCPCFGCDQGCPLKSASFMRLRTAV